MCSATGDGGLDAGDVPALLHVGPRAPARPRFETILRPGLGSRRGAGREPLTIDLDSTIVRGGRAAKQGALRLHQAARLPPAPGDRAEDRRRAHARLREGSAPQRTRRRALPARAGRRGSAAPGERPARCAPTPASTATRRSWRCAAGVRYSVSVRQQGSVRARDRGIPERRWPPSTITRRRGSPRSPTALRRPPAHRPPQAPRGLPAGAVSTTALPRLHHRPLGPLAQVEADHRRHAQVEIAIRDLKEGSGLNHAPSGRFFANAAWLLVSSMAHNLARWIARLGLMRAARSSSQTIRRRYLTLPGRITRSARRHAPPARPLALGQPFTQALARLRAIPLLA